MLERINVLILGMASHNNKNQGANDIPISKKIIPPVKSQQYLNNIERWTEEKKMELNKEKKKSAWHSISQRKINFPQGPHSIEKILRHLKNSNSWEQ